MELILIVLGLLYFLPTVIALANNHPQTPLIVLIDVLLGWTFLGWLAALIWSVIPNRQPQPVYLQQIPQQFPQPYAQPTPPSAPPTVSKTAWPQV
jgi:hypothetical protein